MKKNFSDNSLHFVLKELKNIISEDRILTTKESLEIYSHDETPGFENIPIAIVKPKTSKEVSQIIKLSNKYKIPITPRGGGTGLSGGAVPSPKGIVLSLECMNKIREIDTENLMAVVEPGVVTGDLAKEARRHGLLYPPDPASLDSCTIGGNITECAGGARTIKYGTTRNYVVGLEAVLPTGEIIQCGGKIVKNATGYNLINLLIGSEGTLAVITLAILRLLPLPLQKVSLLILYKNIESAIATVQEIITHKILPSAIELMEEEAIRVAEEYIGRKLLFSNHNYTCSLLIEIDGNRKDEVERDYEELGKIALKKGAIDVFVAEDKFQQQRLWESRRAISEALKSKGEVDHEDIVVPRSKIPDLLLKVKEIEKKYKIKIACYGHVGDGNIHVNILRENRSKSEWKNIIPLLVRELFECTLSLGGTISGEHGIGLAKKPYLRMAISDQQVELMRQIKKVFDPNNILNPGKIF